MRYKPDTLDDVEKSDLIQLSRDLLEATVTSTKILDLNEMSPGKLQEAKVVLGFLNAANNTMKTKMQFFKMIGLDDKINAVKASSKELIKRTKKYKM